MVVESDIKEYKHRYKGEVKFSEVDSFGVVHNIAYLYWIEWARTQYLFDVASTKHSEYFTKELPLMTVSSNIEYRSSLRFADNYEVLTKVDKIGDSSITFSNITIEEDSERIINVAKSVLVYVDAKEQKAKTFPEIYRKKIEEFEG